jgi:hypothetical protein
MNANRKSGVADTIPFNNAAERGLRGVATGLSLCTSFSSVWKHWKRLRGFGATRAPFPGDGRGDGLRMQVA